MAKVIGVGGIFFKCQDPEALGAWYAKWLGLQVSDHNGVNFKPDDMPANSYTVWGLFKSETKYYQPSTKDFMVNLIVDDLEAALQQVTQGGAEVVGDIEESEYGRFGWFMDPEGNKVELWVPPAA